jgi:hypothetical protein
MAVVFLWRNAPVNVSGSPISERCGAAREFGSWGNSTDDTGVSSFFDFGDEDEDERKGI